jgi:phosphoglycolate phosphatase
VNRVLATLDRPTIALTEITRMVGDGARVLVDRALRASGAAPDESLIDLALERFRSDYEQHAVVETRPYPGAVAALESLAMAGWRLGICTNKPERPARIVLGLLGLDGRFASIVGGDTTPYRKPHPAPLLAALDALDVRPEDAVLVGDGLHDREAAEAAGTAFVGVRWGYGLAGLEAVGQQPLLRTFDELARHLA